MRQELEGRILVENGPAGGASLIHDLIHAQLERLRQPFGDKWGE
ncbi:MAG: hypothetical protein VB934_14015 [Polyangiaceae bacterium]